jgi:hypothetical protein
MKKKARIFLIVLMSNFSGFYTNAQSIDSLIDLNQQNIRALQAARGVSDDWKYTGDVHLEDLIEELGNYNKRVGALLYSHTNDTLYINVLSRDGEIFRSKKMIVGDSLMNQVELFNKCISNRNIQEQGIKDRSIDVLILEDVSMCSMIQENTSSLLLPFGESFLRQFDHLIIVPTLNISTVPFGAINLGSNKLFIDLLSYSISPSLFDLMINSEVRELRLGSSYSRSLRYNFTNALFVANPSFSKKGILNLPDLPGTVMEVDAITAKLSSSSYTKLIGANAEKSRVLSEICKYDLLYFATHGYANSENPLDGSFLVLAESINDKDAILTAREIQNIRLSCRLNADLVVLSACQTGLGGAHAGGLIGISRAFQISGANHVLMSLWNIDDIQTAILMDLFFDNLKIGGELMPHEALRQAALQYRKEYNDLPLNWSAFSIFGIPY